jgi:hypothetical protein
MQTANVNPDALAYEKVRFWYALENASECTATRVSPFAPALVLGILLGRENPLDGQSCRRCIASARISKIVTRKAII